MRFYLLARERTRACIDILQVFIYCSICLKTIIVLYRMVSKSNVHSMIGNRYITFFSFYCSFGWLWISHRIRMPGHQNWSWILRCWMYNSKTGIALSTDTWFWVSHLISSNSSYVLWFFVVVVVLIRVGSLTSSIGGCISLQIFKMIVFLVFITNVGLSEFWHVFLYIFACFIFHRIGHLQQTNVVTILQLF